jgi:hypothetical protein
MHRITDVKMTINNAVVLMLVMVLSMMFTMVLVQSQ